MDPDQIYELIMDYNSNPQRYNDEEAEVVATLANSMGQPFQRESKALSKGLFDLLDTTTFGLVPNDWRPTSRGESVYGETGLEKFASGLGTLGGVGLGIGGAYQGARGLFNVGKKALNNVKSRMGGSGGGAVSNVKDRVLSLGSGQGSPLQLGEGQRLLSGQTNRQLRQNRFPLDSTSGQPIPMTTRVGEPIPMEGDVLRYLKGIRRPAPTDAGRTYSEMKDLYGMDPFKLTDVELALRRADRFKLEDSIQNMMDLDAVRYG
tara:strand:+ start:888 stop:1673 length:786 start_codon:yes stop_codon:yes gene_type:complete